MPRIKTYAIDDPISLLDKLIGTEAGTDLTKNWKLEKIWRLFNDTGSGVEITLNDIDDQSSLYDYHGGSLYTDSWIVIRYLKSNVGQREIAKITDQGNSIYSDLNSAWTNRSILNYN